MSGETRTQLKGIPKVAADRLLEGVLGFSQATQFLEIDMSEVEKLKAEYKNREQKISSTAIFIKALALAVAEYPHINARLEGDTVIQYDDFNPGIAMDTPKGLLVLVLKAAQNKSLDQVNTEVTELLDRARNNKITMDDLTGGTMTISNMSMTNVDFFTSIVNNFETVIMGFGRTKKKVVVGENDEFQVRPMSWIMVNINHSLTSGVPSNLFLNHVAKVLENPKQYF